jgi:hypothetical protein
VKQKFLRILFSCLFFAGSSFVLAGTSEAERPFRVYSGLGLFTKNWTCINAWYTYYGYPKARYVSGGGVIGGDVHWGKGWRTGVELQSQQSGLYTQGGYSLHFKGSGANLTLLRKLLGLRTIQVSALVAAGVRETRMISERQLPATASLAGLLGDPNAVPVPSTGSTLHLYARSLSFGGEVSWRLANRLSLMVRAIYTGSSQSRWILNRSILYDSPRSRIDGMAWIWGVQVDL